MPMRQEEQPRNLTRTLLAAVLPFMSLPVAAQDDGELLQQLRACRAIADDALRLVCYDMLGKVQSQVSAPAAAVDSPPAPAAQEPVADPPVPDSPAPIEDPPVAASAATTVSAAAASPPEPVAAAVATQGPEYAPLTDDIGAWNIRTANNAKRPIRATVTRCFRNARDDYFFHFENGQIWKYKGNRRLRYKECSFDVTITRDGFGYKMQPIGEDRTLRISRVD
jgi:nucleoid-associated protein YgaU